MDVAVVKVGVGNTASVLYALDRLGVRGVLTDDAGAIAAAERIIVPGVGAALHAMALLDAKGLTPVLRAFQRPMLGLCLGQQLLFEKSEEGDARGLGLIPGVVRALPSSRALPSPHMGWTSIAIERQHALLEGVANGAYFYFVHSYACPLGPETLASAAYGERFAAIVGAGNAFGCQFHPERSGAAGAQVLRNFLALPC